MGLASAKLLIEAPVNGGRNYNGPKVNSYASLSKTEPNAGNSSTAGRYSPVVRAVIIRRTWGQSAGKTRCEPGTLRDFTFENSL